MSHSLPPVNRRAWPAERSPYSRNRVFSLGFLLVALFTVSCSVKLMSDHAATQHARLEKRQFEGSGVLEGALGQV